MNPKLLARSPDLRKLRNEGYEIELRGSHLLVHHIPYVTVDKNIEYGTLVTPLGDLAGDVTAKPQDHVIHFIGQHPCDKEGAVLSGIQHASGRNVLAEGVETDHSFSNKPTDGYNDYHHKVVTYATIICSQAQAIDSSVSCKTFVVVESNDPEIAFHYLDANSSRAEIESISTRLESLAIAIVGVGGTGSYVLDFVAKTPVRAIHLFDGDEFLSHNAFRAPGAASLEVLRTQPKKVNYLNDVYSKMQRNIIPHGYHLTRDMVAELATMDFVFICIDDSAAKKSIISYLVDSKTPFVDVGIGISAIDGLLTGDVRTTTVTTKTNGHIATRIPLADVENDAHDYDQNIQIAEINAINAAFAVVKWKKLFGVYHDLTKENHSVYNTSTNQLTNDDIDT